MGKGDRRSRRGKIFAASYGNNRKRSGRKRRMAMAAARAAKAQATA
jgi:ribosomal small subunit protein bTHX